MRGKVNNNGVMLRYRCIGSGSDVVLIHGLATNHAFWRLNMFLSLARDHRVTVFDMRGHGYSSKPAEGYTSLIMAEDLHHLLNHLGISKAHLIGHSIGGVVALHYAVLHAERVNTLTIADSRIRAIQPTNYATQWPHWEKAKKKLEKIGLMLPEDEAESGFWLLERMASPEWIEARDKFEGSSLAVIFGGWNGGQRTAERWLDLLNTTTARKDFTSLAGLTVDKLSTIQHPALLVYGENSSSLASLHGLEECLPHCRTLIFTNAGHFFPLTQAERFAAEVSQFLMEMEGEKCG